jgi:hypothetical protein
MFHRRVGASAAGRAMMKAHALFVALVAEKKAEPLRVEHLLN